MMTPSLGWKGEKKYSVDPYGTIQKKKKMLILT